MFNYFLKRLFGLIPTLFIVAVLVFLFVHLLPGDPARLIAGPEADATVIELVRKQLGLDQPLWRQFLHYITHVVQGDFGTSLVSRRPVSEEIASRFMPTLWLTLTSMAWATLFGLATGIVAAVWRNRWPDRLSMTIAVSGISFPAFALGMLLMQVFSVELGWLPTVGGGQLAALHFAVYYPWCGGGCGDGEIHPRIVRGCAARRLHAYRPGKRRERNADRGKTRPA
ncbi:Glutathione transport system permease protein gsiC [Cedecea neteri]|uniref:Glutathione transport system permease protein GsiC n=1 Tax=Cedecea neteri TaxID=158822 RepID=A0A2X3J5F9_9ENTR|nr:Glutathione transport system permease protein gsiC [Cedecea neteri]